jgi:hypothetical protein
VNGGNSQKLFCLMTEQDGYDQLKLKWANTPEDVRQTCIHKWRNYSMIAYCINDEISATKALETLSLRSNGPVLLLLRGSPIETTTEDRAILRGRADAQGMWPRFRPQINDCVLGGSAPRLSEAIKRRRSNGRTQ